MATGDGRASGAETGPREGPSPASPGVAGRPSSRVTWHSDLFAWVERQGWLWDLDDRVSAVLRPFHDRHQSNVVMELLHGGRWSGHPLHPALSDLPVGLWIGSTVLDAADRGGESAGRMDAAGTLSAAGMVGALAAFVTGLDDWTVSDHEDRRVGLFHGLMNTAGLVLQGGSLAARLAGRRTWARALGVASLSVTVGAAYIGGHLVFQRGVMVNRVAWTSGPRRWARALPAADLPEGTSASVEVEGRSIMLRREGESVYALDNLCSHAGGLLSRGPVEDGVVTCPLHGSRFDIGDGRVVRGPAHQPQPVLPARIRKDWIEVRGSWPRPRRAKS